MCIGGAIALVSRARLRNLGATAEEVGRVLDGVGLLPEAHTSPRWRSRSLPRVGPCGARYVICEAKKGRDFSPVVEDAYIQNRADQVARDALVQELRFGEAAADHGEPGPAPGEERGFAREQEARVRGRSWGDRLIGDRVDPREPASARFSP